jgi:hypothetical protein
MRSKLSYYSVLLLVGLAITSGLILVMNPFNSPPASASAPAQGSAPAGATTATTSTVSSTISASTAPGGGFGSIVQPGGALAGEHHHHHSDSSGEGAGAGNSTVTTTTAPVYSQDE